MNALVALNFNDYMHKKSLTSFRVASDRWKCDLWIVNKPLSVDGVEPHPFWQKTLLFEQMPRPYERLAVLDGDMLIRNDCPNLFDLVPADSFGVVSRDQPHRRRNPGRPVARWAEMLGVEIPPAEQCNNGGLVIYSPEIHKDVLKAWQNAGRLVEWRPGSVNDQAALSVLLYWMKPKVTWLPFKYNALRADTLPRRMRHMIYHFNIPGATTRDRHKAIKQCKWKNGRNPEQQVQNRTPITHEPMVDFAELNITYACNLACVGCNRASFLDKPHTPPMTLEHVHKYFDDMASIGQKANMTYLIGGEPTLHPQLAEILEIASQRSRRVKVWSNRSTAAISARSDEAAVGKDNVKLVMFTAKPRSKVFHKQGIFVDPLDCGIKCPLPCSSMVGRGRCGMSVDSVGYALCPVGGTIDALLGLGARTADLSKMMELDFLKWQAEVLCSHCGNFIGKRTWPQTWDHNGTPMSTSYHRRLTP